MVVWVGVGDGAGGVGGGFGFGLALLDVGFGVGLVLVDLVAFGAALLLVLCALLVGLDDGLALALGLPPALGLVDGAPAWDTVIAVVVAAWLNRFMKPTTPTALSSVARQVMVDSLRSPSSRCARSRSRCLMGANETGSHVKGPPRMTQDALHIPAAEAGPSSPRATGLGRRCGRRFSLTVHRPGKLSEPSLWRFPR